MRSDHHPRTGHERCIKSPPGGKVIISKAFIVYTDPSPRYQTTTILGTTVEVEFTPASYTWAWGDGTTTTTTDPGRPYPNQTVTHYYKHTGTGVTTTLTTTWRTRYRPTGETQWRTIEGTITTTETSTPYDLVRIGVRGVSRTGGVFLPVSR